MKKILIILTIALVYACNSNTSKTESQKPNENPKEIKINCKILFITNINPLIEPGLNNLIDKIYFPNNLSQTMTEEERKQWYNLSENTEFMEAVEEYLNN